MLHSTVRWLLHFCLILAATHIGIAYSGSREILVSKVLESPLIDNALRRSGIDPKSQDATIVRSFVNGELGTGNRDAGRKALLQHMTGVELGPDIDVGSIGIRDIASAQGRLFNTLTNAIKSGDINTAAITAKKACDFASTDRIDKITGYACKYMAYKYMTGDGVIRSPALANEAANRAARYGQPIPAAHRAIILATHVSLEEIQELFDSAPVFYLPENVSVKYNVVAINEPSFYSRFSHFNGKAAFSNSEDSMLEQPEFLKQFKRSSLVDFSLLQAIENGEFLFSVVRKSKSNSGLYFQLAPNYNMTNRNEWYWISLRKIDEYSQLFILKVAHSKK